MSAPNTAVSIDLDDGRVLDLAITDEGIILKVYGLEAFRNGLPDDYVGPETYKENVHLGTTEMKFAQWADWSIQFSMDHDVIWNLDEY